MDIINTKFEIFPGKILKILKLGAAISTYISDNRNINMDKIESIFGPNKKIEEYINQAKTRNNIINLAHLMTFSDIYENVTEGDIKSILSNRKFTKPLIYSNYILDIIENGTDILDIVNTADIRKITEMREILDLSMYYCIGYTFSDRYNIKSKKEDKDFIKLCNYNIFIPILSQFILCNIINWNTFYEISDKFNKKYGAKIIFCYLMSRLCSIFSNLCGLNHQMLTNSPVSGTAFNNHMIDINYTTDIRCCKWIQDNKLNTLRINEYPNYISVEFPYTFASKFKISKGKKYNYFTDRDPYFLNVLLKSVTKFSDIKDVILSNMITHSFIVDYPKGVIIQSSYDNIDEDRHISPMLYEAYSIMANPITPDGGKPFIPDDLKEPDNVN